jgi:hypothetical protein
MNPLQAGYSSSGNGPVLLVLCAVSISTYGTTLNICADAALDLTGTYGSVVMTIDGNFYGPHTYSPYSCVAEQDYHALAAELQTPGLKTIRAVAHENASGAGTAGPETVLNIEMVA